MCKIYGKMYDKNDKKILKKSNFQLIFFKQNVSNIKYYNRYFLMTNNRVLVSNFIIKKM